MNVDTNADLKDLIEQRDNADRRTRELQAAIGMLLHGSDDEILQWCHERNIPERSIANMALAHRAVLHYCYHCMP